ncbi:MAG: hypothetical protein IPO88_20490 [Nannocystis sp.]|nr:hypothetical protein [Nannocystis sp.]
MGDALFGASAVEEDPVAGGDQLGVGGAQGEQKGEGFGFEFLVVVEAREGVDGDRGEVLRAGGFEDGGVLVEAGVDFGGELARAHGERWRWRRGWR